MAPKQIRKGAGGEAAAKKATTQKTRAKTSTPRKTAGKIVSTKKARGPAGTRQWRTTSKLVSGGPLGEMSKVVDADRNEFMAALTYETV